MGDREFDIVVFGASGLSGRYCIEQLYKSSADNIKWAVAGRSSKRLSKALEEVSSWVGTDLSKTAVIEADVFKPKTLSDMARRTQCIINTVGPYTLWGEPVIEACLEHGTHLLDLSGELSFNESMRNKYHREAKRKEVVILQTAGFDSVPGEMLLQFAKNNFPGKLNTFETFATMRDGEHGAAIGTGTFNSVVQICKNIWDIPTIRKEAWKSVFEQPWQQVEFKKPRRLMISSRREVPGYSMPFIGGDKPVLSHAEFFRREVDPQYRRTQFQTYLYNESLLQTIGLIIIFAITATLSQFTLGRKLLQRYPSVVSFGLFRKGGPTREQVLTCSFTSIGIGCGWVRDEPREGEPTQNIVVRVDGPEVAYIATATCIVQSAISLLKDRDCLPMKGGYLTPGFALEKSSLLERLTKNGFKFSVIEKTFGGHGD